MLAWEDCAAAVHMQDRGGSHTTKKKAMKGNESGERRLLELRLRSCYRVPGS
jgi:hypothetical protein